MDKPYLRHLFESNSDLLKTLFSGSPKNIQSVLSSSDDSSLDVIIRIFHLIAIGEISLTEEAAEGIRKAKRLQKLFAFESKAYFLNILKSSRKDKIDLLKQFTKVYSHLLYTFFHHTET
jgi:hypothetical protein